ncbi:hypothetical protein, partial [Alloprevotella tannerae]|uniref:hypothetical protein n=1 Tax=Alloprevotella tannerae TaxID=76122 RepID=UPI003C7002FF
SGQTIVWWEQTIAEWHCRHKKPYGEAAFCATTGLHQMWLQQRVEKAYYENGTSRHSARWKIS